MRGHLQSAVCAGVVPRSAISTPRVRLEPWSPHGGKARKKIRCLEVRLTHRSATHRMMARKSLTKIVGTPVWPDVS
eukprot:1378749-Prymnesium_polylepis.1